MGRNSRKAGDSWKITHRKQQEQERAGAGGAVKIDGKMAEVRGLRATKHESRRETKRTEREREPDQSDCQSWHQKLEQKKHEGESKDNVQAAE